MTRCAWVESQLEHQCDGASVSSPRRIGYRAMVLRCHGRDDSGMLPDHLPRALRIAPPRRKQQSMQR